MRRSSPVWALVAPLLASCSLIVSPDTANLRPAADAGAITDLGAPGNVHRPAGHCRRTGLRGRARARRRPVHGHTRRRCARP